MIVQVFMQRRGDRMFHGSFYCVSRKTAAQPFAEPSDSAAPPLRVMSELTHGGASGYTDHGALSVSLLFPIFAIRVPRGSNRGRGPRRREEHGKE